jgi:ATP-dependent Lhr-like helicase
MPPDEPPPSFHPLIRSCFKKTYGKPTAVQAAAWPLIEAGEHVLALAPTGSGKTLTAFLACLSRFAEGRYPADKLSVLYVSPLKALNEDIKRNLLEPLEAIRAEFEKAGLPFPALRVETRSGDTPQSQRRRFLIQPPAILALTPESLAILLHNPRGRLALSTVQYLILDEIHAVLGNKRGSFLSCQIDRLSLIAGEFQRVSLSATVRPPEAAAEFAGGLGRVVRVVSPPEEKKLELLIDFSDEAETSGAQTRDDAPAPGSPANASVAGEIDPGSGNIPGFSPAA